MYGYKTLGRSRSSDLCVVLAHITTSVRNSESLQFPSTETNCNTGTQLFSAKKQPAVLKGKKSMISPSERMRRNIFHTGNAVGSIALEDVVLSNSHVVKTKVGG